MQCGDAGLRLVLVCTICPPRITCPQRFHCYTDLASHSGPPQTREGEIDVSIWGGALLELRKSNPAKRHMHPRMRVRPSPALSGQAWNLKLEPPASGTSAPLSFSRLFPCPLRSPPSQRNRSEIGPDCHPASYVELLDWAPRFQ